MHMLLLDQVEHCNTCSWKKLKTINGMVYTPYQLREVKQNKKKRMKFVSFVQCCKKAMCRLRCFVVSAAGIHKYYSMNEDQTNFGMFVNK